MLDIYVDETCQNNHRYMVLGGVALRSRFAGELAAHFEAEKVRLGISQELKWTKVSRARLSAYEQIVDEYFRFARARQVKFHSVVVDTWKLDHARFSGGDEETGFSKFIYQLLVSDFGRRYAADHRIQVYLDFRAIKDSQARLDELKLAMNNGINARWGVDTRPYRRVQFRKSRETTLLQVADILLGAVGFHKNQKHLDPNTAAHKVALADRIAGHVGVTELGINTPRENDCFCTWNIQLQGNRGGP